MSEKKFNLKLFLICLAIPLAVGGLSAFISRNGFKDFGSLNQPPLSPPAILFPIVWTILYLVMGYSLYLVLTSGAGTAVIAPAVLLFGMQLFFNFFWSIWFFNFSLYFFAFGWLLVMWALIFAMIVAFYKASPLAALINIPYLLWVTFAGYLNIGVALLN